jgi:small subunit ribosomal protein S4e
MKKRRRSKPMTHQKRLSAPRHYPIQRKDQTYITTITGSRKNTDAIPALVFLRDVTNYAETKKEAKEIIRNGQLLRNNEEVGDVREGVGNLDLIELPDAEEKFRVVKKKNRLEFLETESDELVAKITGKKDEGKEYIYHLHNGENYRTSEEYTVGNTLRLNDGEEAVLEEGAQVLVTDGKHAGKTGELQDIVRQGINPDTATVSNGEEFDTRLEYLVATTGLDLGDAQ